MDQGIAGLVGALIGGAISLLTTWGVELRRDRRQARNLAVAAASELDAILMLVQARNWKQWFEAARDEATNGNVVQISIHVRDDYLPMCRSAIAHAGSIDHDLAIYLGRVLTLADGLISDIKRLSAHAPDAPDSLLSSANPAGAVDFYANLISLLDAATYTGLMAVSRVAAVYPKPEARLWDRVARSWNVLLGK